MEGLSYRFFFGGQSHQLIRFLDAFNENLSPHLKSSGIEEAEDHVANRPELTFKRKVTADAGASTAIIGLVFFVANWAGGKMLDVLFEEKFKEGLKALVDKARTHVPLNRIEPIEYRSILCRPEGQPTVVVRVSVESDLTLSELANNIKSAHAHAESWISTHGKKAEIHCHTIVDGQCNLEPEFYENIEDIDTKRKRAEVRNWNPVHRV